MSDGIDELARRLFELARDERPSDELIARIHAESETAQEQLLAARTAPRSADLPPPQRIFRLRWLAIAAVLGGVCLFALRQTTPPVGRLSISAEAPRAAHPNEAAPLAVKREPLPSSSQEPAAPQESPAAPVQPAPPRARTAPSHRSPSVMRPALPSAPPDTPETRAAAPEQRTPAPISAQIELLERARSRLRAGDAAGALEAVDRYDRELHGTSLNDEAALLRIEALAAMGRRSEASALAHRFVAAHPDSPLAERAQRFATGALNPGAPAASP